MIRVAGIDLSGRTTGNTALAWMEGEKGQRPELIGVRCDRKLRGDIGDAELLRELTGLGIDKVAIDAPLTLPHAVTCTDADCKVCFPETGVPPRYGSRTLDGSEPWARVRHIEKPPMPMVMVAGIAFRAIYLARLLGRRGIEVIETWPMGVYRALARMHGVKSTATLDVTGRRELLAREVGALDEQCPPGAAAELDRLDAVAAAYACWCDVTDCAVPITGEGREDEGTIVIPRANI